MKKQHFTTPTILGAAAFAAATWCAAPSALAESPSSGSGSNTPATQSGSTTDQSSGGYKGMSGNNRDTSSSSSLERTDERFVTNVLEANQKEIAFAQLAVERGQSPQVRQFAQRLLSDHTRAARELLQIAKRKGVALNSDLASWTPSAGTSGSSVMANTESRAAGTDVAGVPPSDTNPRTPSAAAGTSLDGAHADSRNSYASASGSDTTAATSGMYAGRDSASGGTSGTDTGPTGTSGHSWADTDSRMSGATHTTAGQTAGLGWRADRAYRRLMEANGQEFDAEFVEMMVDDHQKDVKTFTKASTDAKDSEIRSYAERRLPSLRSHLEAAKILQGQIQ